MQPESELPEPFVIDSTLGIFQMDVADSGTYEGSANGFDLKIKLDLSENSFAAVLSADGEKRTYVSAETSGKFDFVSDLRLKISSWADNVCAETIENYAEDVCYLETKNGRLAYWKYNTHLDAVPVVFVHGGPGGDSNPVKARRLHLRNPVYLYDQLGCGMSDGLPASGTWGADDYAEELETFVNSIPSEKVILVGASWGSGLSVAYAAKTDCAKIKAMVLPSPYLSTRKWSEDAETNLAKMGGNYLEIYKKCIKKKDFGPDFVKVLEDYNKIYLFNREKHRGYAVASASEIPNETFRTMCGPNDLYTDGVLKDFDVTWYLPKLKIPVLFMCADSDEVTVPRITEYCSLVKSARLSVIPHAGHVLALEQFDCYRSAVKAFFEENGL